MEKILDEGIQKQIRDIFRELNHPVEILFFKQQEGCDYCNDTQQLLEEVTPLSDKLALHIYDLDEDAELASQYHVDKVPAFVLAGREGDEILDYGIRFYGVPAGHEFSTLINDLLIISKRDSGLSAETRSFLTQLKDPIWLQVFTTPT
jgi:glutaredoxin-like protein